MTFYLLRARLLALIRLRMEDGEFSERGLARAVGLSQPHVHHILKGARALSPEAADRFLAALNLTVLDLLPDAHSDRGMKE